MGRFWWIDTCTGIENGFDCAKLQESITQVFGSSEEGHDLIRGVGHFSIATEHHSKKKSTTLFVSIQEDRQQQKALIGHGKKVFLDIH